MYSELVLVAYNLLTNIPGTEFSVSITISISLNVKKIS